MRNVIAAAVLALCCNSCATPQSLEFPPLPGAPENWDQFSTATIAGSDCPPIAGAYLEPPTVYQAGVDEKYQRKTNEWLFVGPIPFQRADEEQLAPGALDVPRHGFVIRQPTASRFDFYFFNHQVTAISGAHFRSDEGDFECHNGYIEFPRLISYGMIEGRTNNFQVRNVLLMDETGALVIQSTRGPYRGTQSKMKGEVSYEFIRYARLGSTSKD